MKCLDKDPARRYGSAEALADDLEHWLHSEPITARPVGTYERVKKWVRRRPAIAGLTLTSALLVIILAIGSTIAAFRIREGRDELRHNLYASEMGQAFHALEAGDVHRVRELLKRHRPQRGEPDLRGFEWRYLWGQSRTQEVFTFEHCSSYGCAVSPDGRYVAAADGGTLSLWDLTSGQKAGVWKMPSEGGGADDLAFDPKGKILAAACITSHCIRLYNVETRQAMEPVLPVAALAAHGVAFSPDGRWLAAAGGHRYGDGIPGDAKIWDTTTWQVRFALTGVRDWLTRVKFSPDGRWVAAAGGGGFVKIWEVANGREVVELEGLRGMVFGLCFRVSGLNGTTCDLQYSNF